MERKKRLLVVFAHPDDAEFYCAGTIFSYLSCGYEGYYLCATDGGKGTLDRKISEKELAKIRQKEQKEAARRLGIKKVFFLHLRDGELEPSFSLTEKIVAVIREIQPQLLFTLDPSVPIYELHPDHYAVGLSTIRACAVASLPLFFPKQWKEKRAMLSPLEKIFLCCPARPNFTKRLSQDAFLAKKEALFCHKSQVAFLQALKPGKYGRMLKNPEQSLQVEAFRVLKEIPYKR